MLSIDYKNQNIYDKKLSFTFEKVCEKADYF